MYNINHFKLISISVLMGLISLISQKSKIKSVYAYFINSWRLIRANISSCIKILNVLDNQRKKKRVSKS